MSVQAPSDKRFRRAHVSPTRRRQSWLSGWKRVVGTVLGVGLAVALAVYGGYRAAAFAIGTDALVIQRITVEGNSAKSSRCLRDFEARTCSRWTWRSGTPG